MGHNETQAPHVNDETVKPPGWYTYTKKSRVELLGVPDRTIKPWTSRPGVFIRGTSVQLTQPNFLHELIDCRFMRYCVRHNLNFNSAQPGQKLFCDIRHNEAFQMASGTASMLTSSRLYHYASDRCLIAEEHMYIQGWGHGIRVQDVNRKVVSVYNDDGPSTKKARLPLYSNKVTDLAGNGMTLPDLASFLVPLIYSLECDDLFTDEEVDWEEAFNQMDDSTPSTMGIEIDVDLNLSNKELKKKFKAGPDELQRDGEDSLIDDDFAEVFGL